MDRFSQVVVDAISKDVEGGGCCLSALTSHCPHTCWTGEEGGGDKTVPETGVTLRMFGSQLPVLLKVLNKT